MRTRSKLIFAVLAATAFLSLAVSSANARRIELSNQTFRAVWASLEFTAAGNLIRCPVTLEGSFNSRTISKVCGQLVGRITAARVREASCVGGTARALTETLPWHIQYLGFIGTLPNITGIREILVGARFQVITGGHTCLAGTTQAHPGAGIAEVVGGVASKLRAEEEAEIPLGGEFVCFFAGESHFGGTAEVFVQGSTSTRITVRLVQ
jgi:hypothetical protein